MKLEMAGWFCTTFLVAWFCGFIMGGFAGELIERARWQPVAETPK